MTQPLAKSLENLFWLRFYASEEGTRFSKSMSEAYWKKRDRADWARGLRESAERLIEADDADYADAIENLCGWCQHGVDHGFVYLESLS